MDARFGAIAQASETFRLFFRRFAPFTLLAIVPVALSTFLQYYTLANLIRSGALADIMNQADQASTPEEALALAMEGVLLQFSAQGPALIVLIIAASVSTSMIALAAYDVHQQRALNFGNYFQRAVRVLGPVLVLSLVAGFAIGLGILFFLLPGLYLWAALSAVLVPVIVVERAGWGALGRTWNLTSGHRWSILLSGFLMLIALFLVSIVVSFVLGIFGMNATSNPQVLLGTTVPANFWAEAAVQTVLTAFGTALLAVWAALAYARLREIKEGVDISTLAEQFD